MARVVTAAPRRAAGNAGAARALRSLRQGERGSVIVEFALVAPLLLLLTFGAIDVSRAYYTVNQLATAAREGARAASAMVDPAAGVADVRAIVRDAAPSLGGVALSDDRIEVVLDQAAKRVTVRIRDYPFRFITPLAAVVGKRELALTRAATFRWEYAPS
ncbi:MAG TPA: TadE family protein [Gemmatimonadaceae bacterium]